MASFGLAVLASLAVVVLACEFCENKLDGNYPNPDDCRKFYQCANSLTYVQRCPEELYYDPDTDSCDWPEKVDCDNLPVQREFCESKQDGYYPYPENCKMYYECVSRKTIVKTCPGRLLFNPAIDSCEGLLYVDCGDRPVPTDLVNPNFCANKPDGYYQHPGDCQKFYQCSNDITHVLTCSEGLYFNPEITNCDWQDNVDCGDPPVPTSP